MLSFREFLTEGMHHTEDFEGLTFLKGGYTGHSYKVFHKGEHVASAQVDPWEKQMHNIEVYPQHRRKGIATKIYKFAEKHLGHPLKPSDAQSDHAFHFWKKYRPDAIKDDLRHHRDSLIGKTYHHEQYGKSTIYTVGKHQAMGRTERDTTYAISKDRLKKSGLIK